ncbi:MAG: muramoyltetrapeptide carboxypeptidase [Gammaproteobacteria bacterium]
MQWNFLPMTSSGNTLRILAPGDVVDVIAPASACSDSALHAGLALLRKWQLEPRVSSDLFERGYIYANEDNVRWRDLSAALRAKDSRAIWAVRGGYGCSRLLPFLSRMRGIVREKPLVGFSDVTALHAFLGQRWGWTSVHGPVVSQLGGHTLDDEVLKRMRRVLFGEQCRLDYEGLEALNSLAGKRGLIRGHLVGGNLKVLQSLLGTPWAPHWRDAIVVLEDVNERGYSVDRMLVQLLHSGALRGACAVVFGAFSDGLEADGRDMGREVIERFAASVQIPVLRGLPIGHISSADLLPLGMSAQLSLAKDARLSVNWTTQR